MAITKATSNVLANNAALNNLNAGASIAFTKPVSISGNLTVDTNTLFVDATNDKVGVGTATPSQKLDVNGNINVPTTTSTVGLYMINGTRFAHNYGTSNTFIGAGAGNTSFNTLYNGANVGVGTNALANLNGTSGQQGSFNFGLGASAGSGITTGSSNILIGNSVGTSITTTSFNTIIGDAAALGATGLTGVVYIGRGVGRGISTFTDSVFLGTVSGGTTDGGLQTVSGLTNAIAIGARSFVGASHTMALGSVGAYAVDIVSGGSVASAKLHLIKTTEQLRLGYDASNYVSTTVSSAGLVTLDAVGASAGFAFSDPVTATAQPAIGALTNNNVMTRLLAAFEGVINGNEFRQMIATSSQQVGTGSSGSANSVFGMQASVTTALSGSASVYTFDSVNTHAGFSGAPMRSNILTDAFFHGCMFRVEANTNFVLRINFGVGNATRVPPAAGVDAASARQWGVEFYYDGTNYVGRMYWYDTSMNYGTPFTIPNLTAANWSGMVYSMRMKQTSTGLLEFYINSPTFGSGGGRLSDTPTASMQATWTSTSYGGRHINFEAANGTAAAGTNTRIHCSTMFCRIG